MPRVSLAVSTLILTLTHTASAQPLHIPTTSLLPPLPGTYTEGEVACDGTTRCVDGVIREMTRRWKRLDRACDHDAVFALTYLLTTIEYRRAVEDPAFFRDNAFVNNEDRVFANAYFAAYDAWQAGNVRAVPGAWRVAFEASEDESVTGMGNILLGMNAHIQRDLPYVLAAIGLRAPDGSSRKADHDKVNEILNRVAEAVIRESAHRYDPTIDDGDVPGTTLDSTALMQVIQGWREAAWRNAELLTLARTSLLREAVALEIEASATLAAEGIRGAYRQRSGDGAAARNAYCAGVVAAPAEEDGLCAWVEAEADAEAFLGGLTLDTWLEAQARECLP